MITYEYINANQSVKKGFKVKCGISKFALRETQTKDISQFESWQKGYETYES